VTSGFIGMLMGEKLVRVSETGDSCWVSQEIKNLQCHWWYQGDCIVTESEILDINNDSDNCDNSNCEL
jgi:hypothetical protein